MTHKLQRVYNGRVVSGVPAVRTITCIGCGTTVTKRMQASARYCSLPCYRSSQRPARKTGEESTCEGCGVPIYRRPSHQRRFCSKACANEWQRRSKLHTRCIVCDSPIVCSPSQARLYCGLACRDADPTRRDMLIAMNARQQELYPNAVEVAGYALLDRLGVPYVKQYVVGGKFCVDAYLPDAGLVVQFDGDYWHGHPATFPNPDHRQRRRMALDRSQDAYMAAMGLRVARFWASQIEREPDAVMSALRRLAVPRGQTPAARRSDPPAA